MNIARASPASLEDIHRVITSSIRDLCSADHGDDDSHIETWLAARNRSSLEALVFSDDSQGFICIDDRGVTVGVAHVTKSGEITLCYVAPDHAGKGIGAQLIGALESQAESWELCELTLTSTTTAKRFYESHGYKQYADTIVYFGMPGHPLKKKLSSGSSTEPGVS